MCVDFLIAQKKALQKRSALNTIFLLFYKVADSILLGSGNSTSR